MTIPTLQIQSIIDQTNKETILRTITHLANAVHVGNEQKGLFKQVTLQMGDASSEPIFSTEEIETISKQFNKSFSVRYHFFGENPGTAKGHNQLAHGCTSDYLMLIAPDVVVSPRTIIELMTPFQDETVGMVEARQTPVELSKEYDPVTFETDWASTACTLVQTSVFHALNGFDESAFSSYLEDVDFSWRLRLAGFKIIYQPLAPVFLGKKLRIDGTYSPSPAEFYGSAEASLIMAHKWSNATLERKLLRSYENGNAALQEIARNFKEQRKSGTLPQPIDPEHKISVYHDEYYFAPNRFVL